MRLPLGKIPIDVLNRTVLGLTGRPSEKVLMGPKAGVDFAIVKVGQGYMIASADPITGVSREIGKYAVRISANDVATSGNRPQFAESVVLLAEGSSSDELRRVAVQIHGAAKELGIAILGGHTEVTPGLRRPIVVVTVFSFADSFVTSGGAKDGDTVLMTKTAGLEGTAELAREYRFPPGTLAATMLRGARAMINQVDITKEAVSAFETGKVHAMHDCTEGGVLGATYEMSLASNLGFHLVEEAVPVAYETRSICRALSIDPLRLIGSGSLLIAVGKESEKEVARVLSPMCRVTKIGEFHRGRRVIATKSGSEQIVRGAPEDELWSVLPMSWRRRERL